MAQLKKGQKICVHQYHPSAEPGDAVTNHMRYIQSALQEIGIGGQIFAEDIHPTLKNQIQQPRKSRAIWNCDVLFVHYSQGSKKFRRVLSLGMPKALIYHNITPDRYFSHNPDVAKLCRMGRRQLAKIKHKFSATFADSQFNASELRKLGYKNVQTFPLVQFNTSIARKNKHSFGKIPIKLAQSINLLFVGKVTPHKDQALLIKMLYHLKTLSNVPVNLILIGKQDPLYSKYLRLLAKHMGIQESVLIVGKVTQEELKSYFNLSDAFVCASQHEGFCIPLVEAMEENLPIFAVPSAAISETLGRSGVKIQTRSPEQLAVVINHVLSRKTARERILSLQRKRLEELREDHSPERIQEICMRLVGRMRGSRTIKGSPRKFFEIR